MLLLGIDKGSSYTKTNEGLCIRSTVRKNADDILLNEKTCIEINNQNYIIGEGGDFATDLIKAKDKNTKILTLSTIALSSKEEFIEAKIVLGLPIGMFKNQKDEMKNIISLYDVYKIYVNGKKRYVQVQDIAVFPECAGAFYSQSIYKDCLLIDIGGLSVDTAYFEEKKLKKYSTYSMGTMKLYSKIANKLNSEHDLSLTEWDIPKKIKDGLFIYGNQVDLGIDDILYNHAKEIVNRLKLEYDVKTYKCLLAGGGSVVLEKYIKEFIPQTILIDEPQFSNAIGFANIGRVMFA